MISKEQVEELMQKEVLSEEEELWIKAIRDLMIGKALQDIVDTLKLMNKRFDRIETKIGSSKKKDENCVICTKRIGTVTLFTIDNEEYLLCEFDYEKLKQFSFTGEK